MKETHRLPSTEVAPLQQASLEELLARIRQQHESVHSLDARAELLPTAGSVYSGVIQEYRDLRAFILAQRPVGDTGKRSQVRVIGQAPVVRSNIFDMVANDQEFRIYIPPKNKFIVGRAGRERPSDKPIENLRPQHLLEALFVEPPAATALHVLEENEVNGMRYYVVNELVPEPILLRLQHKWWFRRTNLALVRVQRFGPKGELLSDVHYDVWTQHGELRYPHRIVLVRPYEDYLVELRFEELDLNPDLEPEKFRLEQPAGTERVDLTETNSEKKPTGSSAAQP